mmetsp:Transcript_22677/g.22878  ORF Transcript_22677/g.22878 Transcript_22677/m.22878 type:complete len:218 (-) Transcript_22677:567-1220(-)
MDFSELSMLDPSTRVDVKFFGTDDANVRAEKIFSALKDDPFMSRLQQLAWQTYEKQYIQEKKYPSDDMPSQVLELLEDTGLKELISSSTLRLYERSNALFTQRNVYNPSRTRARTANDEPVECVREVRLSWEDGINEELQTISNELKRTFASQRLSGAKNPLLVENAPPPSEREEVRFLFDSQDLLDTASSIRSSNWNSSSLSLSLSLEIMQLYIRS